MAKLVVSVQSSDGISYFWCGINEIKTNSHPNGVWKNIVGAVEFPMIKSKSDIIKIYLWNIGKKTIFMDDVKVDFVEEEN